MWLEFWLWSSMSPIGATACRRPNHAHQKLNQVISLAVERHCAGDHHCCRNPQAGKVNRVWPKDSCQHTSETARACELDALPLASQCIEQCELLR